MSESFEGFSVVGIGEFTYEFNDLPIVDSIRDFIAFADGGKVVRKFEGDIEILRGELLLLEQSDADPYFNAFQFDFPHGFSPCMDSLRKERVPLPHEALERSP